jgi:hypothetical protein
MPEPRGGGEPAPPPVPEDVRPWRVGQHYGIHVYADDRPVATFFRADEAERAVNLHNAALATPAPPADACDLTPEEASSLVATLSRNGTRDRVEAVPEEVRSTGDEVSLDYSDMNRLARSAATLAKHRDLDGAPTDIRKLEVEVERLTRERDELKRSLERAEYLLSDLEEWEERTHREATVERLTRERDEARRDAECMRGNADDIYAKLQAAEARLARVREALEKASERLQLIGNHALTRAASWITTCAYAYADEARRVLADSAPAGRAAVEESGGERE